MDLESLEKRCVRLLFGKHINRYYVRFAPTLLLGIIALIVVDFLQLKVPEFYRMVVNGLNKCGEIAFP